jgi:hypothetical protein
MADPTISITDAKASAEAKKALSFLNDDGSDATGAQINVWLVRQLRAPVLKSELAPLNAADEATRRAELAAEGW